MKKAFAVLLIGVLFASGCTRYSGGEPVEDMEKEEVAETETATESAKPRDRDGSDKEDKKEDTEVPEAQEELEAMLETNSDFKTFADAYYSLPANEQEEFFKNTMEGATAVSWGGTVLQSEANNIMIYGGDPASYNGQDWVTLMSENAELIPYVINVSIHDKEQVAEIQQGDELTVTGSIYRAGSKEDPVVWMLENGLIIE